MKQYRLLKDYLTSNGHHIKIGSILKELSWTITEEIKKYYFVGKVQEDCIRASIVENNFEWFEEIKEESQIKRWKPNLYEYCYFVMSNGEISTYCTFTNDKEDQNRFNFGNLFQIEEQAEKEAKYLGAYNRLRRYAEFVNEGWEPNWENDYQLKWNIFYNHYVKYFNTFDSKENSDLGQIYFQSEKLAQQCIKDCEEDLLILAGVKGGR